MKSKVLFNLALIVLTFFFYSSTSSTEIPSTNKLVVDYVKTVVGKKVDRGECWDLAYQALSRANAKWDGKYQYGQLVNPKNEQVYPGDIIQFSNVKLSYQKGSTTFFETFPHHTAVVYEVLGDNQYRIAHQNNGFSGRKVGLSELKMGDMVKGKLKFYRPVQ